MSYQNHRKLYEHFGPYHFPETKVKDTIDKLYDQIFQPKSSTVLAQRDPVVAKKLWDPRNTFLDFEI